MPTWTCISHLSRRVWELECDTAGNRGWKALSNGDLVKAAVDAGFLC